MTGRAPPAAAAGAAGDPARGSRLSWVPVLLGSVLLLTPRVHPAPVQARPVPAQAADAGSGDTLRLETLHETAWRLDPRARQIDLHGRAARARLQRIGSRRLPQLELQGRATYQTQVPTAPSTEAVGGLPTDVATPEPPRDRYDLALELEQLLYDGGGVSGRESVERARLAERRSETRSSLYGLREELDRAYFTALLQQERAEQLRLLREDLDARRRLVAARVREGSLVPAQLAAVDAERVRVEQDLDEAETGRRAALGRLSRLLDRRIGTGDVLSLPDLSAATDAVLKRLDAHAAGPSGAERARPTGRAEDPPEGGAATAPWSGRPEWTHFERVGERLAAEAALARAENRPRVSAFARGAVGRPGLDFLDDAFGPYASVGVRMRWSFFDGGGSDAADRALRFESRIVEAEQAALGEALRRRADAVVSEIDRIRRALASDDRLVELREQQLRTAERRLEEGVTLPDAFVERRTDAFEARVRRRAHRVQLAEARARLLRTLGVPLSESAGGLSFREPDDEARPHR